MLVTVSRSYAVQSLVTLLCIRAQLPPQLGGLTSSVVFIDGANTFRLYQTTRLARLLQLDPKQVLNQKSLHSSKPDNQTQNQANKIEQLKEIIRAWGENPEEFLTKDAFMRGNITETQEQTQHHQLSLLAEQLKQLVKKEVSE